MIDINNLKNEKDPNVKMNMIIDSLDGLIKKIVVLQEKIGNLVDNLPTLH